MANENKPNPIMMGPSNKIAMETDFKSGAVIASFSADSSIFTDGKDISDRLQILVRGIAFSIPEVGGAVSGVIGFFWPNFQDPMDVWNKVKAYVMTLMEEIIKKEYMAPRYSLWVAG